MDLMKSSNYNAIDIVTCLVPTKNLIMSVKQCLLCMLSKNYYCEVDQRVLQIVEFQVEIFNPK